MSFRDLINVYSHRSGADNPRGQNFDVNRNLLSLRVICYMLPNNLFEVWFYTIFSWFYTFWCQQEHLVTSVICCKFRKISLTSLILYNFFMILYMYIVQGLGQTAHRGQSFNVNRNGLSLHSFVTSFKKMSLKSDFIHFFSWFNTCI